MSAIYRPQWDENDVPRVRCPHIEGRRIGSDECRKCEHIVRVIDRKYETLIECGHSDTQSKIGANNGL